MKGMKVTVVHLMPTLMERQLDPNAAYLLQKAIEKRGIEILTSANTNATDSGANCCPRSGRTPCQCAASASSKDACAIRFIIPPIMSSRTALQRFLSRV